MVSRKFVVDKENTYYYVQRVDFKMPHGREFYVQDGYSSLAVLYSAERFDQEFMDYSKYSIIAFLEKAYIDVISASEEQITDQERFDLCTLIFDIRKKIEKRNYYKPNLVGVYDKFMQVLAKVNDIRIVEPDITLDAEENRPRVRNSETKTENEVSKMVKSITQNEEFVLETKHERVRK